jgi:hypothetical protein
MKKKEDKRLIIPKDAFEEEASEGLGKLNREEAAEDLRELKGRLERRLRKPRMIWLPAAAAVVIMLVASTVYIALFRDRSKPETEIAMAETAITDTALIAMAQPITVTETKSTARLATPGLAVSTQGAVNAPDQTEKMKPARVEYDMAAADDEAIAAMEVMEEEAVAEEVIVEAMPRMEKAAAYEKKEIAAATKTIEDAAAATPSPGAGMTDRQPGPIGGMEEFNSWIQRNIIYPEEVAPRVRQMIVVTFKVAADSTLYDLKAEQTPGRLFTNEAFRLLREGPKWVPAIRNNLVVEEEIRISIIFK